MTSKFCPQSEEVCQNKSCLWRDKKTPIGFADWANRAKQGKKKDSVAPAEPDPTVPHTFAKLTLGQNKFIFIPWCSNLDLLSSPSRPNFDLHYRHISCTRISQTVRCLTSKTRKCWRNRVDVFWRSTSHKHKNTETVQEHRSCTRTQKLYKNTETVQEHRNFGRMSSESGVFVFINESHRSAVTTPCHQECRCGRVILRMLTSSFHLQQIW